MATSSSSEKKDITTSKGIVLHVSMGDRDAKKLVVPVRDSSIRVFELASIIAGRFRVERVAELRVQGGYLLDNNDTVADVLRDGQYITACDYKQWVGENNGAINDSIRGDDWISLENADFSDNIKKWISCGWAWKLGKFYVRMGGYKDSWVPQFLELFDPEDLANLGKPKLVAGHIGNKDAGWNVTAEFVAGTSGAAEKLIVRCKSATDAREAIKSIGISFKLGSDTPIVRGEVKTEQLSELPEEDVKYDLPASEAKGPVYPDPEEKKEEKKETPKIEPTEIKGEGSLPLLIVHKGIVELDQTYQREAGQAWDQLVQTEVELLNRGETALVLSTWKAEYKNKAGDWVPVKLTRGLRSGAWNYQWESGNLGSVSLGPKNPTRRGLGIIIPMPTTANQMSRRRAIHHSLPNPMEVRFTIGDVNGGSCNIVIPAKSGIEALHLNTLAQERRSQGGSGRTNLGYLQCDDTDAEGRIHASIWYIKRKDYEDQVEIRQSLSNSYHQYKITDLKKIAFNAAKEGKATVVLPDVSKDCKPACSLETVALIDVTRRKVYGIRFNMKTGTSSATASFSIKTPPGAPAE